MGKQKIKTDHLIGMRTFKSGLAVTLITFLSQSSVISNPFYAVMGTLFGIQPTIKDSITEGKERLIGTLLGGLIGFLFASIPFNHPILMGVSVIVAIVLCNKLRLSSVTSICLTILLSILVSDGITNPLQYSLLRIWDTSIGVLIGTIINFIIARPDYKENILLHQHRLKGMAHNLIKNPESSFHKRYLKEIKKEISSIEQTLKDIKKDTRFSNDDPEEITEFDDLLQNCQDIHFHLKSLIFLQDSELEEETKNQLIIFHKSHTEDLIDKL